MDHPLLVPDHRAAPGKNLYEDQGIVAQLFTVDQGTQQVQGVIVRYSNPPFHFVSTSLLESYHRAIDKVSEREDLDIAMFTRHHGPLHVGADLQEVQEIVGAKDWDRAKHRINLGTNLALRIAELSEDMVTVGLYNGDMYGGSAEIALMPEYTLLGEHSRMIFSECAIGIIPGWAGWANLMSRVPNHDHVRYLVCTGDTVKAKDLFDIGAIHQVLDAQPFPDRKLIPKKEVQQRYDDHETVVHCQMFPQALDFALQRLGGFRLTVSNRAAILPIGDDLRRIIAVRSDPSNYTEFVGMAETEAMKDPSFPKEGLPVSPASIEKLDSLFELVTDAKPEDVKSNREQLAKREAEYDFHLYPDPRFLKGIASKLRKRTIPDFRPS